MKWDRPEPSNFQAKIKPAAFAASAPSWYYQTMEKGTREDS